MKIFTVRLFAALVAFAPAMFGATIPNPSFEADTFTVFPGYITGNAPITGWSANQDNRAGINPSGGSPFADNGAIPAGSQVAFIQSDETIVGGVTMDTVISGLTVGVNYKVSFRVNARSGNTPNLKVDIDGTRIVDTGVTAVGGTAPYKYFAFDFTAAAASQTLTLRNDAAGDNTVVIDDFSIATLNSGWSYAAWTDDASSGVDGTKTYTHAYSFGSATATTINGIAFTGVAGGNPSVAGSFSTAGMPNVFNNDGNNLNDVGSRPLANDFLYNGFVQSITLNGLIPGGEYLATIYSVGWENGTRAATFSVGSDRLTVNQDHFGDNNGIRVSYRYIATANSITLTYVPLQGNTFHTYGFNNYVLSTPSTPSIGVHPKSQRVGAGDTVTFTVVAAGTEPLSYHWRKDNLDLGVPSSPTLTLSSVTTAEAGVYSVIVSNASGTATSSNATLLVGLPIVNRSFEVDTFTVFPGYVSGNTPITGWTALGGHGINPGGGSPFADNGVIPDGQQVAFMQQDGAMSQVISGFTVGDAYYVLYSENARSGGVPAIELKIGDTTIVPAHSRSLVGGGNPYVEIISDVFAATATDLQLSFIKSNPNGGDTTALIDNVAVLRVAPGTAPFISKQPQSQSVAVNDAVTFTGGAVGSLPLTYQWRRNGAAVPGATGSSFTLSAVAKGDEGDYTLVVTNSAGSVTSLVARLTVFEPITTLFNTGLDANHVALADNSVDPNYSLIVNPDVVGSSDAIVEDSTVFPIVTGPWVANTASSKWIGPRFNTSASAVGLYTYRTTFNLSNRDPSTVVINGRWSADNTGVDILVNGTSTGNPQNPGFNVYTAFMISTSNAAFLPGINTIDFVVENVAAIGYTGLRAEFTQSNARILPNIPPEISASPGSQVVVVGDDVTFNVTATGSDPITYQWTRNGVVLAGKTNRTLTLPQAGECDSGDYRVTVANGAGMTSSVPATLSVAFRRLPGIYGTGVDNTGALLANGTVDPHYTLSSSADANFQGPDAFVLIDGQFPIPPWVASGPRSKWIAPRADQTVGNAEGNYTYQTFIDLTGVDISRFRLSGQWAVDNLGVDIVLNGTSTGNTNAAGFAGFTPFVITSGFVDGLNGLEFVMNNLPTSDNPTGLRVDLAGLLDIRPVVSITRLDSTHVSVAWSSTNSCHRLEVASETTGPWTTITPVTNPHTFDTTVQPPRRFFRIAP